MADTNPFPPEALAANRAGRLTDQQRAELGADHKASKRSGWQAGLALCAFGALLTFGAVSGRIDSGRIGAFAIGSLMLAGGVALLVVGGATRTTRATGEAAAGHLGLERVEGDIRRQRIDNSIGDSLVGASRSYHSPDAEYTFLLHIGGRRLEVSHRQYEAAPDDGHVVAYLLAGTGRVVNLERVGRSAPQVAAEERAAAAGLHQGGVPASAEATAGPALDGAALAGALIGRWANPRFRMAFEIRPDGTLASAEGTERWEVVGPGRIRFAGDVVDVALTHDGRLFLTGADGPTLELHRA